MVEEKYERNYADFIKFMNKDSGIKKSPSVNKNEENKKTNAVKRTPSIRPFDETKRSVDDVKTVFDELYQSKLENLNRETQLTETQLESKKLEILINKANGDKEKKEANLILQKKRLEATKESIPERKKTLETFRDLNFSNEVQEALVAKAEELTSHKNQETRKKMVSCLLMHFNRTKRNSMS